jgi:cytochrome c oxidase cbb3-type subunit 3
MVYMGDPPAGPGPPPPAAAGPPRPPRTGPVVLNPRGKQAQFDLKDGRLASLDAVKEALDKKRRIVIVDARPPSDWLNLHITGAISTPYYDPGALDDIPNDGTWVIAYCACPHHASGAVVDELRKRGYPHTAVLDEGIFAWQHKGYPVVVAPGMLTPPAPPPPRR